MVKTNVKKIIFSSSCAIYGSPLELPLSENHPKNPTTPYGFSKWAVERMLQDYQKAYQIKSISLRYFNAAGADITCSIGELHHPETHLIPLIFKAAMSPKKEITIFGSHYKTPDGTCIRDYVHVSDLAQAHVLALKKITKKNISSAYNLSNGKGFSVKEVITVSEKITKCKLFMKFKSPRKGDSAILIGNSQKAFQELGWKANIFDLETIIDSAYKFYLKRT